MLYKNKKKIEIFRYDMNIYDYEVILKLKKIWKFYKFDTDKNKNLLKKIRQFTIVNLEYGNYQFC